MPFVQTLRCSCEKIKGQVDKLRYRCEVPLNKDTHTQRGREREATSAVELLLSPKFSTTRCSCPHHQLVELTVALAVGPLA